MKNYNSYKRRGPISSMGEVIKRIDKKYQTNILGAHLMFRHS